MSAALLEIDTPTILDDITLAYSECVVCDSH